MRVEVVGLIYNSRNYITLLGHLMETFSEHIYNSRNYITLLGGLYKRTIRTNIYNSRNYITLLGPFSVQSSLFPSTIVEITLPYQASMSWQDANLSTIVEITLPYQAILSTIEGDAYLQQQKLHYLIRPYQELYKRANLQQQKLHYLIRPRPARLPDKTIYNSRNYITLLGHLDSF